MSSFWNFTVTMVSGSLAKAADVNLNLSGIDAGFTLVEVETDAIKLKTDFISVTQAVDLDTMESDIATNSAKTGNATHTGDVTGSEALTITNNAVLLGHMADMATASLIGRNTGGTGDPEVLSAATARSLLNIENGATADQTNAEIRAAVEAATDSNVFTDADHTKLNGIETAATADQTDAEIRTAVEAATDSNVFTDADHTKLNSVGSSNVTLNTKVIDIGDWDMDGSANVSVAHGLTLSKIRGISVLIRNDDDTLYYDFSSVNSPGETTGNSIRAEATNVVISRSGSGLFDSTVYNATSYNRGWITIKYID